MNDSRIRIAFTDFWPDFDPESMFLPLMRRRTPTGLQVVAAEQQQDVLVYSVFGRQHERFREPGLRRVYYTGENYRPPLDQCDFAISFDHLDHPKHIRMPQWRLIPSEVEAALAIDSFRRWGCTAEGPTVSARPRFCGWVASFPVAARRTLVQCISQGYQPIDCGGKDMNNVGGPVEDKLDFLRTRRFCFAAENAVDNGYCTEKLLHAYLAGCIPIYWGDPVVERDFNPDAMVVANHFATVQALVDHGDDGAPTHLHRQLPPPTHKGSRGP